MALLWLDAVETLNDVRSVARWISNAHHEMQGLFRNAKGWPERTTFAVFAESRHWIPPSNLQEAEHVSRAPGDAAVCWEFA